MWGKEFATVLWHQFVDYRWGNQLGAYQDKIEEINELLKECLDREDASITFSNAANGNIICDVNLGISGSITDFAHEKRRLLFSEIIQTQRFESTELILLNNAVGSGHIIFTFSNLREECLSLIESDLAFYLSVQGDEFKISNRFKTASRDFSIKKWKQSNLEITNSKLLPTPERYEWEITIYNSKVVRLFLEDAVVPYFLVKRVELKAFAEMAGLRIASQIGIKTPIVERKMSNNAVYQFSQTTRMTAKGSYQCKSLCDYHADENDFVQAEEGRILKNRKRDGTFSWVFEIDKISISRLLVAILLFGWSDLSKRDIGLIKSKKMGIKNTK